MTFNGLENIETNQSEYCFLVEDTNLYSDGFKVNIPKFMPLISMEDKPKVTNIKFNNKILLNDDKCKPDISKAIDTQNYLTISRFKNSWFRFHPTTIEKKTRFVCKILNNNLRNIFISDDEFDTTNTEKKKGIFVRNPSYEILDKISVGDTVKASYVTYSRQSIGSCQGGEHDDDGHNACDFECTTHVPDIRYFNYWGNQSTSANGTVSCVRKYCQLKIMNVGEGKVKEKHDWGLVVELGGVNRHIAPDAILGFYKKAGEYDSYY